jgi:hypothetical protein
MLASPGLVASASTAVINAIGSSAASRAQVDEPLGKTDPAIDLGEWFDDIRTRQHAVEPERCRRGF